MQRVGRASTHPHTGHCAVCLVNNITQPNVVVVVVVYVYVTTCTVKALISVNHHIQNWIEMYTLRPQWALIVVVLLFVLFLFLKIVLFIHIWMYASDCWDLIRGFCHIDMLWKTSNMYIYTSCRVSLPKSIHVIDIFSFFLFSFFLVVLHDGQMVKPTRERVEPEWARTVMTLCPWLKFEEYQRKIHPSLELF